MIEGRTETRPRPIGFQSGNMATLSDNRYKLVIVGRGKNAQTELYDLLADPREKANVADAHPEIVRRMQQTLKEFQASCNRSAAGKDYQ